jgi:hypothetical protein
MNTAIASTISTAIITKLLINNKNNENSTAPTSKLKHYKKYQ